ncbi:MAG: DUF4863 family protein [Nannocystaceae bacterium]
MSAPTHALLEQLAPFIQTVAGLPLADCRDSEAAAALAGRLQQEHPAQGPAFQSIGDHLRQGVAEGWLCDRGEPDARFCRLAKARPATADLSIDVVALQGAALRHRHPRGEITMAYPAEPGTTESRFDGHPAGWVVMPAGSVHTPTVTGSRMLLLYFLPGGAVEWTPGD